MGAEIRSYRSSDLETLRALLAAPEIVDQFDAFAGPGALEQKFVDPHLEAECIQLAFQNGDAVGFVMSWLLPDAPVGWAMIRAGVLEGARRRGLGSSLIDAATEAILAHPKGEHIREITGAAWLPSPASEAISARLGYRLDRTFWLMRRPREVPLAALTWPAGIATREFDGSEAMARDLHDAYMRSFAYHWRFVPSAPAHTIALASGPRFALDGLMLAYRGEACVGFCRLERFENRSEIAVLGTTPDARGIGLGRALLRWGVTRLAELSDQPITLIVDGENENALQLYRSEGFEVARTRKVWMRALR